MVLGCGRPAVSVSKIIWDGRGSKASFTATSVRCPRPVFAREPNRVTWKLSAPGYAARKRWAAKLGPMVWELEGPRPIL